MRISNHIQTLWDAGGPFIGPHGKPNTIVTVQLPWDGDDPYVADGDEDHVIHPTSSAGIGNFRSRGLPIRWYQKADNSQVEQVLPNVQTVTIDRSIDSDAATCEIRVYNQWMRDNDDPNSAGTRELGIRGYFTWDHGQSPESQSRWNQIPNEWENVLVPNTVVRTYQGFGGTDKTLEEALADGNVILTGVWLIDRTATGTDGMLTIACRDMAKLLIVQQLYPPLVPRNKYPLKYFRYVYQNRTVQARTVTISSTVRIDPGDKRTLFRDSAVDRWYPQGSVGTDLDTGGFVLHGHKAVDCLDGDTNTYCLSVGNSEPTRPFAFDWWEFGCGEAMNAVYVNPWKGNYIMYVSVMEDGRWQGSSVIPYNPSSLFSTQDYAVNTGAAIPYVASFGVPWEQAREYILPRVYRAERVRVTFTNGTYTPMGPWHFRSGMREFRIRASAGASTTTSVTVDPAFYAADTIRDPNNLNTFGYVTVSIMHQIDVFGDAAQLPKSGGVGPCSHFVASVAMTPTGDGYWVLCDHGHITSYGAAQYYGDPSDARIPLFGSEGQPKNKAGVMVRTHTGLGYWVIGWDGQIYNFGDAPSYTDITPTAGEFTHGAATHLTDYGLWVVDTSGQVFVRGAATHFGNWNESVLTNGGQEDALSEIAIDIAPTAECDGYWILTTGGRVDNFGAAADNGQIAQITESQATKDRYYHLMPAPSGNGYLITKGDGQIFDLGVHSETIFFGAPIPGSQGQLRRPGNYLDYSDIIKDLALWSGFLLFDPDHPSNEFPPVFGSIETTGAFSESPLPDDLFDKRPVIDAMTELKETVGYLLFVDDTGRLHFESPNWWAEGNFDEDGNRLDFIPEIDESIVLTNYTVGRDDEPLRSLIVIAAENPDEGGRTTVSTMRVPQTAEGLKGLHVPAMWVNGWFQDPEEQSLMADLISMHIWFQQRIGQVSCTANPCIQINDQIRINERNTSESYIHYVRAIRTSHNLDTGEYTMDVSTNWLGSGGDWVITASQEDQSADHFYATPPIQEWIERTGNSKTSVFGGRSSTDPTWVALGSGSGTDNAGPV